MLGDNIKVQSRSSSSYTDEQLMLIRQMGIKYVYTIFEDEDIGYDRESGKLDSGKAYDGVMRFTERLKKFGLTCTDAGNTHIYKNDKMHLGLEGRDQAIENYNEFNRILSKADIHVGYMTWEPNQVYTSKWAEGKAMHGAVGRIVDADELAHRSYTHGRFYSKEEIWANFEYWLKQVLPVCEEYDFKISLHPNDPPVSDVCGISNLITSAESYKHAFKLADDSPYLGMKMCIGCWLEGGDAFGKVLDDIKYFVENGKVLNVHFRNVSSTLPRFEETLLEDGYQDMYLLMKQFVRSDYKGTIHADHVPLWGKGVGTGGSTTAWAYSMGYLKGLLNSAIDEVNGKA
ncbi:MAG: mannonate dehydratase [Lachnospiraceae bacterium]|jgi:mannonate dehydratase